MGCIRGRGLAGTVRTYLDHLGHFTKQRRWVGKEAADIPGQLRFGPSNDACT